MIIRKSGFYWCLKGCIWDVNYWSGGQYGEWWIAGSECTFNDDYFDEIDEIRASRKGGDLMSTVELMGTQMTARCAMVIRHVINGLSYAEIAEQTGFERTYIKSSVAQCRMKGLDIPRAPRSSQKPRPKSVSQSTMKMIEMAKAGMTTEEIAKKVGISKKRVSGTLSYHRTKGEDLPIYTLPLDEYEALNKQGLSQHRIAQELGIGKMKASSCVRSLVAQGRIDGNNMRNPCSKNPAGKDLWAMALGRKELY